MTGHVNKLDFIGVQDIDMPMRQVDQEEGNIMLRQSVIAGLLGWLFVVPSVHADQYFKADRADAAVPAHCRDFKLPGFATNSKYFVYGIDGARSVGFEYEIPLSRLDAAYLWDVFRENKQGSDKVKQEVRKDPRLERAYDTLLAHSPAMGFTFEREGDVLEVLSLVDLREVYPSTEYFHTGGISYSAQANGNVTGEIDLLVARKSDCAVVAIGEAKLGLGQLSHARKQLQRLHGFLKKKLCKGKTGGQICKLHSSD